MSSNIIISKIQRVSGHGSTLYVYVPRSCYYIVSADSTLYAYLAEDVDGSATIVYSPVEPSALKAEPIVVIGNKIVLVPSRKAMIYRVNVVKSSRALALRIPKPFARVLGINPKDSVNIVCYDDKIIVKPVPRV